MTTTDPRAAIVGRITAGLTAAGQSADMDLTPTGAAEALAIVTAQLPTAGQAAALEPLWPQVARVLVAIAGGAIIGAGWMTAEDYAALSGAVLSVAGAVVAAAPIVWRVVTTLRARRAITGA